MARKQEIKKSQSNTETLCNDYFDVALSSQRAISTVLKVKYVIGSSHFLYKTKLIKSVNPSSHINSHYMHELL